MGPNDAPDRQGASPKFVDAPIPLSVVATEDNFDEAAYLDANPDVLAAVRSGVLATGRGHFDIFGKNENRRLRLRSDRLAEARAAKLARLRPFLRRDMPCRETDGRPDYLTDALRAATCIVDTSNISSNDYDDVALALIEDCRDGLVLDCGAGQRNVYHHNVVNFEIVAYDTTDVLGVGEALPFVDDSFDAALSFAVLEHVRDPLQCAREIARVLKPGGRLLCCMPFLQPLHAYPHHYFNATSQGLRRLFEDLLQVESVAVPPSGHPAYALHWILHGWAGGLLPQAKGEFLDKKVGELIGMSAQDLATRSYAALSSEAVETLACAFLLSACKPSRKQ